MCATPTPAVRPGSVTAAFWCWLIAAVLMAAFGMLLLSVTTATFFKVAAILLIVVGLAQGYLAGRTGSGLKRFSNAGAGLALASVVFLAVLLIIGAVAILGVLIVAFIMALLIAGTVSSQRPSSQKWYETKSAPGRTP